MSRSRDIANLLGAGSVILSGAPSALDTLDELAAALGDDANYASTVTTALNNRVLKTGGDTITVSSGTTVPLTIQNNGTGNSFVVNDVASDTTPFVIDASGNVGIGTSSPDSNLNIIGNSTITGWEIVGTSSGNITLNSGMGTSSKGIWINWRSDYDAGAIQGEHQGVSYKNLLINPFGGNVGIGTTSPSSDFKLDINGGSRSLIVTNAQNASYTLVLTDAGKVIEMNNAAANTLTVPTDASVNFPVGTVIDIFQTGAGQTTVGGAGVTINARPGLKLSGQWATATLIKRAANTWLLTGSLSA